jgi:hypothetical protein
MARPVRVDIEGGWYHVTARGIERRGGREAYRQFVQQQVTRGRAPEGYEDFGGKVALGSREFQAKVKDWVGRVTKEQPDREQVLKRVIPADVVEVVERIRGVGGRAARRGPLEPDG